MCMNVNLFLYCSCELTCLHKYSTYDTIGSSGMQLPWVICLVICAFNESWCTSTCKRTN